MPNQGVRGYLSSYATLPGMLAAIVAVVAGALVAMGLLAVFAPQGVVLAAAASFVVSLALFNLWGLRWFSGFARGLSRSATTRGRVQRP